MTADDDEDDDDLERPVGVRATLATVRLAWKLVSSAARRELAITVSLTVLASMFAGLELGVGRRLVQLLVGDHDATAADVVPWLVALGAVLILGALVGAGVKELQILLNELVRRRAMEQVLEAATRAELQTFDNADFHNRLERATQHSDDYAWEVVWGLISMLTTLLSAAAISIVLLAIAPLLVLVAVVAYIPLALVSIKNTKSSYELQYDLTELDRDLAYHERLLTARVEAKEVRAFGLAGWLRARHAQLFATRIGNTRQVVRKRVTRSLVASTITSVVLVIALGWVMILVLDDRVSVADGAIAVVALQQLSNYLGGIGGSLESLVDGVTFLRDFESFRTLFPPSTPKGDGYIAPPRLPQAIRVESVDYRYPAGTEALTGISLELRPGTVTAVVGPNGAGKSTLAKLLCGLLRPTSGTIRWDDVDTADCDPAAIRDLVAPVFQDYTRYEHTAREAIGFGDVRRMEDIEAIRAAAQRAGVDDFIVGLDHGYETRLSTSFTDGSDLSVGQWQRLAIARAFFRDAPFVVMDEPAASLDPRAERDLFDRLHDLGRERTVLFISHRFATVHRADHIIVLLGGRIAEQGTHDELMQLRGVYSELYTLQADQFR